MAHVYLTEAELEFLAEHIDTLSFAGVLSERGGHPIADALSNKFKDAFQQSRERRCVNCGIVLTSPNPRKTTCGDACRQAHSRKIRARRLTAS